MQGEKNLNILLKSMKPKLREGEYVFCSLIDFPHIDFQKIILFFKEDEGNTLILKKEDADYLKIPYFFTFAWIELTVHSALDAVGLTAAFFQALASKNISCNVVAGFYHDHIFVETKDATNAMKILNQFSE